MAEAVVGVLIGKLGAALAKEAATYGASLLCMEASALKGLFGEIRKAEKEFESMKAYLRQAEKFKDTDETTGIFTKNIRELSFQIEDVVDEFMYKLEDDKHGGFAAKMKKRIKHVKVWHRLAHKLRDINVELEEAAKRRARYVIPGMQGQAGRGDHARPTNQNLCFAREDDVVGIEDNATKLKQWLIGDLEEKNYKIATVWGMGGVGKTTLVDHVYKIVKLDFDAAAWVTVSKSYQFEDLLKRIAREFSIVTDATNMEIRGLVEIIRKHLEGKRYILVLYDVWEKDVWINNIMEVFPTNCTSRFVLTSRKFEVASLATSNCRIELEPLGDKHSWELFCKAAFRSSDDKRCPSELQDLAVKFLQKCEGLPIAIACIGRLLSVKQPTYSEWDSVYMDLELQSNNNVIQGVDSILKVSLEDLPHELKNCFLHCAIFPEDYKLGRRRLIRHWITSGFIKEKENKTLEQVAEGYLNDLVNRSLLQVVMKNEFGRLRCCRMHDIIRHFALDKAAKECFCTAYEGHGTFSVHETRRLSINSTNIVPLNQSGVMQLRAIYVFTSSVDIDLLRPILASSTLLSTLDLQGTKIKMLPNEVFSLFNLRFLGLRYTGIETLPEAVGRLQNLEVLDALDTGLLSLPKDVGKLKKLRYLYATVSVHEGSFWRQGGVKVPRGIIKNLTGLHALQRVKASSETLRDVAALTDLRTFAVDDVTSEHSLVLRSALQNMSSLVHLSIGMSNENEALPLEQLSLPETLSKLVLIGQLEKKRMPELLSSWLHLNCLTRLSLMLSKLDENSFPNLMVLRNLCSLNLFKAYEGKTLCFSVQSFPRLRELFIWDAPQLSQVEIEEGALGSLVELRFAGCPELKRLPHGIEYLTTLDELYLEDAADELIKIIRQEGEANECNEELMKISHIRMVDFKSTEKNFWRRIVNRERNAFAG
ncbi:disease resistance protein RPM1-like [Miscanthus floridulus]|uniref:disease resistance protein RPM1-like n=1 Tax=Miscanthus floridulus TaxID=154761 RepID=UPI00345B0E05